MTIKILLSPLLAIFCSISYFPVTVFGHIWSTPAFGQSSTTTPTQSDPSDYGVDVSYPIHRFLDPKTWQAKRYRRLMDGCAAAYSEKECMGTERARLEMSMAQPASQHNYTELGFKKLKLPADVWEALSNFYQNNKHLAVEEKWSRAYTYVNHWESPSYMVSVEDMRLQGAGQDLKQFIWDGVKPIIEEWVGREIFPTSMYGVRIYTNNSVLATHVDRLPLVSSCIINVDQEDMLEPWPIEVYDHSGKAHNVTMEPGDMVLYESSTVLHGRPAPLRGSKYANIFVHFKPIDHDEMNKLDAQQLRGGGGGGRGTKSSNSPNLLGKLMGGHEDSNHNQDSLARHTADAERQLVPGTLVGEQKKKTLRGDSENYSNVPEELVLNIAAAKGHIHKVKSLIANDSKSVHARDMNGWQPLHEAIRAGHTEVVKFLVENGADIASLTSSGASPLWWAKRTLEPGHSVIKFLEDLGAPEIGEL